MSIITTTIEATQRRCGAINIDLYDLYADIRYIAMPRLLSRLRRPTKRQAHLAAAAVMTAWLVLVVIPA